MNTKNSTLPQPIKIEPEHFEKMFHLLVSLQEQAQKTANASMLTLRAESNQFINETQDILGIICILLYSTQAEITRLRLNGFGSD